MASEQEIIAAQVAEIERLKNKVASLEDQLYWLRKKMYGKMSEKNLPLDPTVLSEPTLFVDPLTDEGTRLQHCITMHKRLFGVDVKKIGGDTSYAGTVNRDYCKEKGIQTSFVKRGRPSQEKKEKDFVRQELARVRATAMEGSFGTQKEHYDLTVSRPDGKQQRSFTSSLESIPQIWSIWQSG